MKIGMMNFPAGDVFGEIKWASENGFDFLDFTLEPPLSYYDRLNTGELSAALKKAKLDVVGHTAYYLPIGSPLKSVRSAAAEEIVKCLDFFDKIGAHKVNVHPDFNQPHFFTKDERLDFNIESLQEITGRGKKAGIDIMLENLNSDTGDLNVIFSEIPDLKFHCDVGHANLMPGECDIKMMIEKFSTRLKHVHVSDNKGGYSDLHSPLGAGLIDWHKVVTILKDIGYDNTITLEVFSPDKGCLIHSRKKLKKIWEGAV